MRVHPVVVYRVQETLSLLAPAHKYGGGLCGRTARNIGIPAAALRCDSLLSHKTSLVHHRMYHGRPRSHGGKGRNRGDAHGYLDEAEALHLDEPHTVPRRKAFFENTEQFLRQSILRSTKDALTARKRERVQRHTDLFLERAQGRRPKPSEDPKTSPIRKLNVGDIVTPAADFECPGVFSTSPADHEPSYVGLQSAEVQRVPRRRDRQRFGLTTHVPSRGSGDQNEGHKRAVQDRGCALDGRGHHGSGTGSCRTAAVSAAKNTAADVEGGALPEVCVYKTIRAPLPFESEPSPLSDSFSRRSLPGAAHTPPRHRGSETKKGPRSDAARKVVAVCSGLERCTSSEAVLSTVYRNGEGGITASSPELVVAAFAQLTRCRDWQLTRHTSTVARFLDDAEQCLASLDAAMLTHLLIALSKLKLMPRWFHRLLRDCDERVPLLTPRQLSGCLNALKRFPVTTSSEVLRFKAHLLEGVAARLNQFTSSADLCSLGLALAALRVDSEPLVAAFVECCVARLADLSLDDLVSVAWTIAKLPGASARHPLIMNEIQRKALRQLDTAPSAEVLVSLCWSLGATQQATEEFLKLNMGPYMRPFIPSLSTPHLVTIPWAFARNGITDDELMTDILFVLSRKVEELTASHMTTLLWSFGKLGLGHPTFFDTVAARITLIAPTFHAHHLARSMLGLSKLSVAQDAPYRALWQEASYHLDVLQPWDILTMLIALTRPRTGAAERWRVEHPALMSIDSPAASLSAEAVPAITRSLSRVMRHCTELSCLQCCQFLTVLETLRRLGDVVPIPLGELHTAARAARDRILQEATSAGSWGVPATEFPSCIAALLALLPTDTATLEECFSHLRSTFTTFDFAQTLEFLAVLASKAGGRSAATHLLQMHLHRRPGTFAILQRKLATFGSPTTAPFTTQCAVVWGCANVGLCDDVTQRWYNAALYALVEGEQLRALHFSELSKLLFAYAHVVETADSTSAAHGLLLHWLRVRYDGGGQPASARDPSAVAGVSPARYALGDDVSQDVATLKEKLYSSLVAYYSDSKETSGLSSQREQLLRRYVSTICGESFVRMAWICLRGTPEMKYRYVPLLMEDAVRCYGSENQSFPEDVYRTQQVCAVLARRLSESNGAKRLPEGAVEERVARDAQSSKRTAVSADTAVHHANVLAGPRTLSDELVTFIEDVLLYKLPCTTASQTASSAALRTRNVPSEADTHNSRFRLTDFPFADVLSNVLTCDMKLKHKLHDHVANVYAPAIVFPQKKHVIDVLDFPDLTVPSGTPTGTYLVRQQQLLEAGYTVTVLHLNDVYQHAVANTLTLHLAQQLLPRFPECQRFLQFKPRQEE